jgi:hypothetical protein
MHFLLYLAGLRRPRLGDHDSSRQNGYSLPSRHRVAGTEPAGEPKAMWPFEISVIKIRGVSVDQAAHSNARVPADTGARIDQPYSR